MIPQPARLPPELKTFFADLPVADVLYYPRVGSTNDVALEWAAAGAADWSLVIADEQTRGRGRFGRRWHTPPQSALAFSVIARPSEKERAVPGRFAAWGAMGVAFALEGLGLKPRIKWPNDVLLGGAKVCGVLAEAVWEGDLLAALVVGVGVNVLAKTVPPRSYLDFPATSVEEHLETPPSRWALLRRVLAAMAAWRSLLPTEGFLRSWEERLAYRGLCVQIGGVRGTLLGLSEDGGALLRREDGERIVLHAIGRAHLRPCDGG